MEKDLREIATARPPNALTELWRFMADNKKWWLAPIVCLLLLLGLLIIAGGTVAAPFIYTIF